jgi:hypothetical protein
MSEHTPTPWVLFVDGKKPYAIMPAGREGDICSFQQAPSDEDADFIIAAVNNHESMLRSLEQCAKLFDVLASTMERWATESREGGWSTHQVSENRVRAADCRRYAATIRSAIPKGRL